VNLFEEIDVELAVSYDCRRVFAFTLNNVGENSLFFDAWRGRLGVDRS
jgi:hypothetical protein